MSSPHDITELGEGDLSKDEDSVTSLAVGHTFAGRTTVYAGVNSSLEDVANGKNEHFRAFSIQASEKSGGAENRTSNITELGRSALFVEKTKDIYQRVLRLSKPNASGVQLGALASGLAKKHEIVLFDTMRAPPTGPLIRGRIQMDSEAADVDIIPTGEDEFLFAYCTDKEVFIKTISSSSDTSNPVRVYLTPGANHIEKPTIPSFRALRFITPEFLLMLTNIHGRAGVILQVLRIREGQPCSVASNLRLPASLSHATGLAVANLTPTPSPSTPQGYAQYVVAVAGHDTSISLYTLEYQTESGASMTTKPRPYCILKNVHPLQITSLAFSTFTPPTSSTSGSLSLKLASVSMGQTVVLHTLPIIPLPPALAQGPKGQRYVLMLPAATRTVPTSILFALFAMLLAAFAAQAGIRHHGDVATLYENVVQHWVPEKLHHVLGRSSDSGKAIMANPLAEVPALVPSDTQTTITISTTSTTTITAAEAPTSPPDDHPDYAQLLHFASLVRRQEQEKGVIYVRHEQDSAAHETSPDLPPTLKADLHDVDTLGPHGAKSWEELEEEEQEGWKAKLKEAGHWSEELGVALLKGVVFGELGGVVRAAVGG